MWDMIVELVNEPKLIMDQLKKRDLSKSNKSVRIDDQLKQVDEAIARLKLEEQRMVDAYGSGALSIDQLKSANQSIQNRMNKHAEELHNLNELKSITID